MMATTHIRVPTSLTELLDTRPDTREMISANLNLAHACILAQDGLATEVEQALTQALRHNTPGSITIAECVRAELARASGSTVEAWSKAVTLLEKDRTDVIAALYLRFLFQWRSASDTASLEKSESSAVSASSESVTSEVAPEAPSASVAEPETPVSAPDVVEPEPVAVPEIASVSEATPADESKSSADPEEAPIPEVAEAGEPASSDSAIASEPVEAQASLPEEDVNFEWQSDKPSEQASSQAQPAPTSTPDASLADVESSVESLEAPESPHPTQSAFEGGWVRIAEDESLRFLRIVNADGSLQQVENQQVDIPSLEYASITLPAHLLGQLGFGYMKHSAFEGTHAVVHAWQSTKCYAVLVCEAGATAPALAARATRAMEENR